MKSRDIASSLSGRVFAVLSLFLHFRVRDFQTKKKEEKEEKFIFMGFH